ncbi:AMP-binding protein [Catenulispora rubra]|uniref:AMP-binding protein n=1 Tax=Catenulispora rubra TaxID=280293 RepID=UPI0018923741|nr:AMP-binding protein [Catenulispora rubra]
MTAVLDPADPRVPEADDCVLGPLLRRQAAQDAEAVYAVFPDGTEWSRGDTLDRATRTAAALQRLGADPGTRVLIWLPNGADALRVWFGTNLAGAVSVPINTAYQGSILEHVIADSGAAILVTVPELTAALAAVDPGRLRTVVVLGDGAVADLAPHMVRGLDAPVGDFREPEPLQPWDVQSVVYTSGTTGPSKGVVSSYAHLFTSCTAAFRGRMDAGDRYLLNLPLFHAGGMIGAYGMLVVGGSIAVVPGFRTGEFWDVVRRTRTTGCTLLGVMAGFLLKDGTGPAPGGHPLRLVYIIPLTADTMAFGERFGVDVYGLYNMTELSCPIVSEPNPAAPTCGRVRAGIQARIADPHDREVAAGTVGELLLRADRPWAFAHGYLGRPEATAASWRNGWFHTGDGFRQEADGSLTFVDRMTDSLRRRGENISSIEVEAQLLAYPAIREAAVVAVPGEHGEDDVLAVLAPVSGAGPDQDADPDLDLDLDHGLDHGLDLVRLVEFLIPRMAYFMVPRYFRVVDEIPKTPTGKPLKAVLRAQGITIDTWDREAAGLRLGMGGLK